jgi:hypothetical protein
MLKADRDAAATTRRTSCRSAHGQGWRRQRAFPAQQLRQLGDVYGDAPGLVAGEQLTAVSAETLLNSFGSLASGTSTVNRCMPLQRRS